jgi:hypothetical protein
MNVTTEIGNRREFVLKQALLIYEDQVSKRDQLSQCMTFYASKGSHGNLI